MCVRARAQAPEVGPCAVLGAGEPLALPGWGVEAVLKNTEYRCGAGVHI